MEFTRGIETLGGISLVKRGGPVRPEIWPISEKLNFPAALAYTRKPSGKGGFNNMLHLNTFFTRPQKLLEMQLYADLHLLVTGSAFGVGRCVITFFSKGRVREGECASD